MSRSITSFFINKKRTRLSTSSSESDCDTPRTNNKDKKRVHLTDEPLEEENVDLTMSTEESLNKISARFEEMLVGINDRINNLATKEDIKQEVQILTQTFMDKIEKLEGRIFEVEARKDIIERETQSMKKENETLRNTVKTQELQIMKVEREQNRLQQYSRRWNLRFFKIPEKSAETAEDCVKKCCDVINQKVKVEIKESDIEVAHRAGKPSSTQARPILVRFFDRKKRDLVLANRRNLKNKGISIGEDLTPATYRIYRDAAQHSACFSVWTINGQVIAKLKNGKTMKLDIHTNVNQAFRRGMAGLQNQEDVSMEGANKAMSSSQV